MYLSNVNLTFTVRENTELRVFVIATRLEIWNETKFIHTSV